MYGFEPYAPIPYYENIYEEALSIIISISYTLVSLFFFSCGIILVRYIITLENIDFFVPLIYVFF